MIWKRQAARVRSSIKIPTKNKQSSSAETVDTSSHTRSKIIGNVERPGVDAKRTRITTSKRQALSIRRPSQRAILNAATIKINIVIDGGSGGISVATTRRGPVTISEPIGS
jgi:N-acetylmuramoyl-L-alanine amidase